MPATNRRKFIASTALAAGAAAVKPARAAKYAADSYPIIHHVFFWLKNPDVDADRQKLIEGLRTLAKIKEVHQLQVGVEAATKQRDVTDKTWAVSELIFFKSLADQAIYQDHPVHWEFVKNYSHLWEKVVVYDVQNV